MVNDAAAAGVEASLVYAVPGGEKPSLPTASAPPGTKAVLPEYERHATRIQDARALDPVPTLDGVGFTLCRLESAVADYYDPAEVERVYYPEVEALVKRATGAIKVHVFDHNVRNGDKEKRRALGIQGPVKSAHNDYTDRSTPQRVRDLLPEEADALLAHRFTVVNVWKPIRGPVESSPLAVCDAQSIGEKDLVATDLVYDDRTGEVQLLAWSPEQRWFYYPAMRSDEVLLLKCFDSERDGRARFTAHTAFEDPGSPEGAAPRESIEVRTLVFDAPH